MILMDRGVHKQPACLERLYLPREELGRSLHSVEHKSEHMLLQLNNYLTASATEFTRQAAILKVESDNKTYLSMIHSYLRSKYAFPDVPSMKALKEAQKVLLKYQRKLTAKSRIEHVLTNWYL